MLTASRARCPQVFTGKGLVRRQVAPLTNNLKYHLTLKHTVPNVTRNKFSNNFF